MTKPFSINSKTMLTYISFFPIHITPLWNKNTALYFWHVRSFKKQFKLWEILVQIKIISIGKALIFLDENKNYL